MRGSKAKAAAQTDEDSTSFSPWDEFPSAEIKGREIFVAGLSRGERTVLEKKGYVVVDVIQLARTNDQEHQRAIEGWLQGMSEGTIPMDRERRLSLELEARARGQLVQRSMKVDVSLKVGAKTMEELMKSRDSRFTLNRADEKKIVNAALAAVTPNFKEEEN